MQKSFRKKNGSHCDMNFVNISFEKPFKSLQAAMGACLSIGTCHKVLDAGCDTKPEKNGFRLCNIKPPVHTSLKSCIYEKTDQATLGIAYMTHIFNDIVGTNTVVNCHELDIVVLFIF